MASIDAMALQVLTVDYVVTRMLNEEAQSGEKGVPIRVRLWSYNRSMVEAGERRKFVEHSGCRTSAKIRRNLIL